MRIAAEIRSELEHATSLPEGDVGRLLAIYAALLLAKGSAVSDADVHNGWAAWMSFEDSNHPALLPFSELDADTASGDRPFAEAIRAVATRLGVDPCRDPV